MGLFSWLGRMTAEPPTATFSESAPMPIDQMFIELRGNGTSVTRAEALSVPAVLKGRNMLASIGSLPLIQLGPDNAVVRNPLLEQVDPDVANVVTLAMTVEDLVFDAVAWWRITGFGFDGYPMTARRLDPSTVSLDPPIGRTRSPLPSGDDPRGAPGVWVSGEWVSASEIIRFDSPNPAVLKTCGRSIKRAARFDRAAERYARNPRPLDYFTPSDGVDAATDEEIEEILHGWQQSRQTETTAYVPAALNYNTVNTATPADLQLVQLQQQVALDLARALGVDPEDLGVSTTSRSYANIIDRRRDRINDVYAPYMRAIGDRLSMPDVTKRGYRVLFDLADYMKSNPTERWMTYEKGKNLGVYTVEEIRRMEGLPPITAAEAPQEEPQMTDGSVNAAAPAAMTFDAEQNEHTFSFTADDADHTFAADTARRTVSGVALPYNKVTVKYGMKFRFKPGSIEYADVSRVKHYKDHVTPVGKALSIKDTRQALTTTLSVANGATGDELLQLAEDGVYDGLSVGVDFSLDPESGDVQLAKDGVYDVLRASLREISSTPMPSFDDARLTKVVASRDGGNMTETAPTGQPPAADPAPAPAATFSAEQIDALRSALGLAAPAAEPTPEPRPVVNPTRLTASVNEAAPYRFDRTGNLRAGSHDFSTDLIAWHVSRDQTAHDRAMEFIRAQFDVATTDVNELNPTTNRPELYVDQRQFRYPVWEAISKGSLDNITPFTFPKFNSASGLVGAHTEGTEPTSGTLVTTSQTVTPGAVSGKATINREVWDQGGNPQVSGLIWGKMVQGWYEALEAKAVAALDAVTPTAIALTAGGGTTGQTLDAELTAAFAALQFVRGGFSMDQAFAQIDLYKALVAAQDDTGRRLYPAIGPNNALGTVGSKFAALDVNGVTFYPAWALAATGSVVASSYLFDQSSVHGWASAPQRLDITMTAVATVDIGLWGYSATAISDLAGVREITYDPVP